MKSQKFYLPYILGSFVRKAFGKSRPASMGPAPSEAGVEPYGSASVVAPNEPANSEQRKGGKPVSEILGDYLTTTDAHKIGIMYILFSIVNFALAGFVAIYMRLAIANSPPTTAVATPGVSPPFDDLLYTWFMSLHGLGMLLLFAMQAVTGVANILVPKLIGAPDLYWPRVNALSLWMQVPATAFMWSSLLFWQHGDSIGWTLYPPLSTFSRSIGVDLILLAVIISGMSSTLTGINFLLTITRLRRPDIKMLDMSLFAWSILATSLLMVVALPPLAAGAIMLLVERHLGLHFFTVVPNNPAASGDPRLFQHIFWFFGHPEVYILVLPAMGLVSEVIQRMARRRAYGYTAIAVSSVAIASISFAVWMHHMFTAVQDYAPRLAMAIATMAVAIPSGVKVFNWTATLYGGRILLRAPMLFMFTFLLFFIVGGVTGVFFPVVTLNPTRHLLCDWTLPLHRQRHRLLYLRRLAVLLPSLNWQMV